MELPSVSVIVINLKFNFSRFDFGKYYTCFENGVFGRHLKLMF